MFPQSPGTEDGFVFRAAGRQPKSWPNKALHDRPGNIYNQ